MDDLRGEPCVLLKFGELALKGRNRPLFVGALERNLRRMTADLAPLEIRHRGGVFIVTGGEPQETLVERCLALPGVSVVQPGIRCERDPAAGADAAVALLRGRPGRTFAVRSRRRDKRYPLRSIELSRVIGEAVRVRLGLDVDLSRPDLEVHVELDHKELLVSSERLRGAGGLPVGSSGRALVLMSGGIDSPVAAHRMMRRGLRVDFLHFSGIPFTTSESIYKAYALVRQLDRFQGRSRLWVVPFGKAQQSIKASGQDRLAVITQRRLMLKTAEEVAHRIKAEALITGDSLGQVSSQTMANITAQDNAVDLPILRPLIGMDKSEIMAEARRIGTLEISELPDEDCCTLLAPRRAETRAKIEDLKVIEKRLDAEDLAVQLADSIQAYKLDA
jgi:tRNA uracil 4-sulfurtransferase